MADIPKTDEDWRDRIWDAFAKEAALQDFAPRCLRAAVFPVLIPADPASGLYMVPDVEAIGIHYTVSFEPGEAPFVHISAIKIRDRYHGITSPDIIGKQIAEGLIAARTRSIEEGTLDRKALN